MDVCGGSMVAWWMLRSTQHCRALQGNRGRTDTQCSRSQVYTLLSRILVSFIHLNRNPFSTFSLLNHFFENESKNKTPVLNNCNTTDVCCK